MIWSVNLRVGLPAKVYEFYISNNNVIGDDDKYKDVAAIDVHKILLMLLCG